MSTTLVSSLFLVLAVGLVTPCLRQPEPAPAPVPPPPPPPAPAPVPSGPCRCGVKNTPTTSQKIVGGVETDKNEYPWQVALVRNGQSSPFCGGTLISSREILTAAHCATSPNQFQVVLGEHNWRKTEGTEKTVGVTSWTNHPDYNGNNQDNDFAILTLSEDVPFTTNISPACLPTSNQANIDNKVATVTGWGTTSSGGGQPNVLMEANVNTMSNGPCKQTNYGQNQITDNMLCASATGKDSCQGDSGGPLVYKEDASYSVVGVVSWGYSCAQPGYPGVYSRVTAQLDWIKNNMKGSTCPRA